VNRVSSWFLHLLLGVLLSGLMSLTALAMTRPENRVGEMHNYSPGLISQCQVFSGTVNYYGYGGHGSVCFRASTNGAVPDSYKYDASGTLIASIGAPQTVYLYAGQQFDPDLGFYYNRARYLNLGTGRFWTMDTYEGDNEDPLSLHKYLYCHDNPVTGLDPSGHDDIGSMMMAMDISASLDALPNITTVQGALSTLAFSPAIIVYFNVDTQGEPPSFHASDVQTTLQTQLSALVFDNPPAGHSVTIQVREEAGGGRNIGVDW